MSNFQTVFEMGLNKGYKKTVKEALEILGKKNFALIIHGASFPSVEEQDAGMGSPNSQGARNLVEFAEGMFNSIQLGPAGKTKAIDSSPYTGTIFSNNPLFIDIFELTSSKYSNILSEKTYNEIVSNNPNKGESKVAYSYAFQKQNEALREAFKNFALKLKEGEKTVVALNKELEQFKSENAEWLEKDSVYEALTAKYSNDYWPLWKDSVDKNLFNAQNAAEQKIAEKRLAEIKEQYAEEIEFYCFCQFIAAKQKEEMKEYALSKGIKMIADRQVAFSDRDCWANQSLFLSGWNLGCPPDYFSKDGQAWGFPVMDPEKTFNKDGSLGDGGELLFQLYRKMFKENPGGVRIDHIIGLIDPWVYKSGNKPKPEEGAGRLFSSPEHPELCKYAIATMDDLDTEYDSDSEFRIKKLSKEQVELYGALIEKIVIAAAKAEGIGKEAIICEDLGTLTYPVEKVMEEFELRGMRLTQFVVPEKPEHIYRGINTTPNTWIMVGTHDNEPISMWAEKMVNTHEGFLHAKNLAEDLVNNEAEREEKALVFSKNPAELAKAKFIELFTANSENVQIFFSDFFGIKDVYNRPGTSGDKNWSLRLPNNFGEFYASQLAKGKGLNLPEVLIEALKVKGLDKTNPELVKKLEGIVKA